MSPRRAAQRAESAVLNPAVDDPQVLHVLDVHPELVHVVDVEAFEDDVGRQCAEDLQSIAEPERFTRGGVVVGVLYADILDAGEVDGGDEIIPSGQNRAVPLLAPNGDPSGGSAGGRGDDVGVVFAEDIAPAQDDEGVAGL